MSLVLIDAMKLACQFANKESNLFEPVDIMLMDTTYFMIGRNGSGKSTLAKLLAEPSSVVKHFGRVGYLSQGLDDFEGSVAEKLKVHIYLDALRRIEHGGIDSEDFTLLDGNWDIEVKLKKDLTAYGLSQSILYAPYAQLSGGQRTRLSLLALHRRQCDFYILDEPSNHLDFSGRQWLLIWIKAHPACLIITHDLLLLKQSVVILELSSHGIHTYRGGWQDYLASKKQLVLGAERQVLQTERKLKESLKSKQHSQEKLQAKQNAAQKGRAKTNQSKLILDKQKATSEATGGRLATLSQQRVVSASLANADAKKILEQIKPQAFIVSPIETDKKKTLSVTNVIMPYGQKAPISFQLSFGERLWVLGDNGSGKSSLLKIIQGQIKPISGEILRSSSVALLDQHFSFLDNKASAVDNFERLSPGLTQEYYRTILAQLRLRREAALQAVNSLSGGETIKLALACLFSGKFSPALLLLDEPDNHLDLESKALLIETLKQYQGTMVIISHDEDFVSSIGTVNQLKLG